MLDYLWSASKQHFNSSEVDLTKGFICNHIGPYAENTLK